MFTLDETAAATVAAESGVLQGEPVAVRMLDGGFMNTVMRVEAAEGPAIILKHAGETLRAFPEIAVTPDRLRFEHDMLVYLAEQPPMSGGEVPRPLWFDPNRNVLAMTDLGANRRRLEDALIAGDVDTEVAAGLGRFLADLHSRTAGHAELAVRFDNPVMHALRLEFCFFGFCDDPAVVPYIEELARAFTERKQVLLHGDFWTASVLVDGPVPGIYDFEFCNFGDPAQDVGFMLAHYLLHYHNTPAVAPRIRAAVEVLWQTYRAGACYGPDPDFAHRVVQQIGVEMLFRVSGINTVAYVTVPGRQAAIMEVAKRYIVDPARGIDALWS